MSGEESADVEYSPDSHYQLAFSHLIGRVASLFADTLNTHEIKDKIQEALSLIGEGCDVDRTYIFEIIDDSSKLCNTFEWVATGIQPMKEYLQDVPAEECVWWMKKVGDNEAIVINDVGSMPEEARYEQKKLQAQSIQSLLVLPLEYREAPIGFWGFDWVRKHASWRGGEINLLEALGGIFCHVLHRRDKEVRIRQMEKAFKASDIGVVFFDENGRYLEANKSCRSVFGVHDERNRVNIIMEDIINRLPEEKKKELETEENLQFEFPINFTQDRTFYKYDRTGTGYLSLRYSWLRGDGYLLQLKDITEQKEAEQKLRDDSYLLEKSLKERKCLCDISYVIQEYDWRKSCEKIVEIIPSAWSNSKEIGVQILLQNMKFEGENFKEMDNMIERPLKLKGADVGSLRICGLGESPLERSDFYVSSICERLCSKIEKCDMQQRSQEAEKMKMLGRIAGGVAHDFNNVLAGIIGSAELIHDCGPIRKIIRAAQRGAKTVDQLLRFASSTDCDKTVFDVQETVRAAVDILKRFVDRNVDVRTKFGLKEALICGDESLVENSLINLGVNACHSMSPKGGGVLMFETSESGETIRIDVTDEGLGIDERIRDQIFEPFFSTKKPGEGTGLGLSAVYGTMKSHGGKVMFTTEVNVGTVFSLLFPKGKSVDALRRASAPCEEVNRFKRSKFPGKCVLVVDDEEIVRKVASRHLGKMGIDVLTARNGFEAVKVFKEKWKSIDLVILDMCMPLLSGSEAFFRMKEIYPKLKVLISSGYRDNTEVANMISSGAIGELPKPFSAQSLSNVLSAFFVDSTS